MCNKLRLRGTKKQIKAGARCRHYVIFLRHYRKRQVFLLVTSDLCPQTVDTTSLICAAQHMPPFNTSEAIQSSKLSSNVTKSPWSLDDKHISDVCRWRAFAYFAIVVSGRHLKTTRPIMTMQTSSRTVSLTSYDTQLLIYSITKYVRTASHCYAVSTELLTPVYIQRMPH